MSLSLYAKLITPVGLGMAMLTNIAIPSSLGGSSYQTTIAQERPFSLVVQWKQATLGDRSVIEKARAAIMGAVSPNKTVDPQPVLIQYDQLDSNGVEVAETLQIPAVYVDGLGGTGDGNAFTERTALNFKTYAPYIRQDGNQAAALGYQNPITNANYGLKRNSSGTWSRVSSSLNAQVLAFTRGLDGSIYMGGEFTNLGDANGDYIVKISPDGSISSLGTGANNYVYALVTAPNGDIYAGGLFTSMGGVANTARIARWDGTQWNAVGGGIANFAVNALAINQSGVLFVGGGFTNHGDANGDYITSWDGAAWHSLGTGMDDDVTALVTYGNHVIATGYFTTAGGTGANKLAIWNTTTSAWSAVSSGLNDNGFALIIDPYSTGNFFVGGSFTTAGGISANGIAYWNGNTFLPLGSGVVYPVVGGVVRCMAYDHNRLWVGGVFTTAGGIGLPDSVAIWTGSTWLPVDVDEPGTPDTNMAILIDNATDSVYLGYATSGTATSAIVTASTAGNAPSYPIITYTGPGTTYQLKNYTTGKAIYFNLTLLTGETAVLNLDPRKPSFTSSFRGDIWSTILPGSNTNFELLPGANNISAFMYGSTGATSAIVMTWANQYESTEQALR